MTTAAIVYVVQMRDVIALVFVGLVALVFLGAWIVDKLNRRKR